MFPLRPNQDAKAKSAKPPRGWWRALLLEDWGLKILALVITLGLWFGVTEQRTPETVRMRGVQLVFLRQDDVEISNDTPETIQVTLRGSKQVLTDMLDRTLTATVDISGMKLGSRVAQLNPKTVTMDLPPGVQVVGIDPPAVSLRLEKRIERAVPVEARLEGRPASGYEVYRVQIAPAQVRVRGAESRVNAIQKVLTETIPLDNQRETFVVPQASVEIPDRKLTAVDPIVNVRVEIGEERVEKKFDGVAVYENGDADKPSRRISVVLRVPRSLANNLHAEDLSIVLDRAADGTSNPRLKMASGVENEIELVSTAPPLVAPH